MEEGLFVLGLEGEISFLKAGIERWEIYYGISGNGKLLHRRGLRLFMSVIVEGKTRTND